MKDLKGNEAAMTWWLCELAPTTSYSYDFLDPRESERYSYVVLPIGENWDKWAESISI